MRVFYYMLETPQPLGLPPSDEELVRLTLQDKEHFGGLIERYEGKLRRYLYRLGISSEEDQDDVLQEVFLKTYKNLNSFDMSLRFSSWIYRIAHNEAVSFYRKRKVRPEGHMVLDSEELLPLISDKKEAADELFDKNIDANLVKEALVELDDKYREVMILRYFEHKDYDEISDILRIPTGSVGTLLHRGKKKLATVLKNKMGRINNDNS